VTATRTGRSAAAGLAGAVLALVVQAILGPSVILTAAMVAVTLMAPTAERLNRRLALNGALVLGWFPVAMWFPGGWGPVNDGQAALAAGLGLATAAAVAAPHRIRPTVRRHDGLIALTGLSAALVMWPLIAARSPARALSVLTLGWDQTSHFAMYLEQRFAEAAPPFLPMAPDGGTYAFGTYPRWFHSLAAVLADAGIGPAEAVGSELVMFATLQWGLFVLLVIVVVAATLQALERGGNTQAVAACLLLASLVVAVPGGLNLMQGHLSFLLAALAPALIYLLAVSDEAPSIAEFAAVAGLVVIAGSWMLVLPIALIACWPATQRALQLRNASGRIMVAVLSAASLALTALLLLGSWRQLPTSGPAEGEGAAPSRSAAAAVAMDGDIISIVPAVAIALLAGAFGLTLWWRTRAATPRHPSTVLAMTAVALVQTIMLGAYLIATTGELTYYFWKVSIAMLLAVGVTLIGAWPTRHPAPEGDSESSAPLRRVLVIVTVALVATAGLGVALREAAAPSLWWAFGIHQLLDQRAEAPERAEELLAQTSGLDPTRANHTTLLATRDEDLNAAYAQLWFHTLARARFGSSDQFTGDLFALGQSDHPSQQQLAVDIAEAALDMPGGEVLVTDPALMARLTDVLNAADLARVRLAEP
jgi:hypothetical protein